MASARHPRVVVQKLGKRRAWGLYDGTIWIDPRSRGKARLEVLVHEYFHHLWPDMPEAEVGEKSALLADFLHKQHVRITESETKSLNES